MSGGVNGDGGAHRRERFMIACLDAGMAPDEALEEALRMERFVTGGTEVPLIEGPRPPQEAGSGPGGSGDTPDPEAATGTETNTAAPPPLAEVPEAAEPEAAGEEPDPDPKEARTGAARTGTKNETGDELNFTRTWQGKWKDARVLDAFAQRFVAGEDSGTLGRDFGLSPARVGWRASRLGLSKRALGRDQPGQRTCLRCSETFDSDHAGHRICSACKPVMARAAGGYDEMPAAAPALTGSLR